MSRPSSNSPVIVAVVYLKKKLTGPCVFRRLQQRETPREDGDAVEPPKIGLLVESSRFVVAVLAGSWSKIISPSSSICKSFLCVNESFRPKTLSIFLAKLVIDSIRSIQSQRSAATPRQKLECFQIIIKK